MSVLFVLRLVLALALMAQPAIIAWSFPRTSAVLLVARPQVQGPYFARSVVLVTGHGQGAAVGVVLNRPSNVPLERLRDRARADGGGADEGGAEPVYVGGPVDLHRTVFLLRSPRPLPKSLNVLNDIYMSENTEALREALAARLPPSRFRVFKGFAAWAPGQLEREIERDDWLVLPADPERVFADPEGLWEQLVIEYHGGRWVWRHAETEDAGA